ncbi:hypothetical protein [Vulcanisaeta souniana]|uniref:PaREP5ab n=1 Tax=Vulcanisaeta souniana JCM 11219 TaxID=1293586 RepID=A0A830E6W1_9CREN|nr:hypothetical protein [Vulcanisaeta souniana]BDR91968.1 hypothetical protein Vsou_10610 [Vulcanisaeta souniana JCM 11219]GGI68981.1 hypothetical protein GCM10007112_02440 [Vulcanisaeta souniana JCM 11219]
MDELIYVIGLLITIIAYLAAFTYWLGRRFEGIDWRFRDLEERLSNKIRETEIRLDGRINDLENRINSLESGLKSALINVNSLLIEYMGLKGLFSQDEVRVLTNEVGRVVGMVRANSISKEELEFIKSVFSKDPDQMSIEELERVIEIAKRWWEDNSEIAFKVFQVASIVRAYKLYGKKSNSNDWRHLRIIKSW